MPAPGRVSGQERCTLPPTPASVGVRDAGNSAPSSCGCTADEKRWSPGNTLPSGFSAPALGARAGPHACPGPAVAVAAASGGCGPHKATWRPHLRPTATQLREPRGPLMALSVPGASQRGATHPVGPLLGHGASDRWASCLPSPCPEILSQTDPDCDPHSLFIPQ